MSQMRIPDRFGATSVIIMEHAVISAEVRLMGWGNEALGRNALGRSALDRSGTA